MRPTAIAGHRTNLVRVVEDKPAIGRARVEEEHNDRAAAHLQNQAAVEARHQPNPAAAEDQRANPVAEQVVPVRDHPLVPQAETRWVITPHRGAITVEIAAAVMAAAAETMRARAATVVVIAWVAGDTVAAAVAVADLVAVAAEVVVVAAVEAVAAVAAVVEDVVAKQFDEEQTNENKTK